MSIQRLHNVSSAAQRLALPMSTVYYYVKKDLLPCADILPGHIVFTEKQIRLIEAVLAVHGRKGIREGLAVSGE